MDKMLCLHGKLFTIIRLHSKTKIRAVLIHELLLQTALMSHREAGLQQVHANYTSATLEALELQTHKLPHARGDEAPRVKLRLCWSLLVSSL